MDTDCENPSFVLDDLDINVHCQKSISTYSCEYLACAPTNCALTNLEPQVNEIDISFDTLPSSVEVFDKIGEGASSVVFDGFDYEHQRPLAIRFLKPELRANPQECQSFWDEARMLASLGLSHTVGVHQIDQDGGFVLMERAWQPVRESASKSPVDPQIVERVLADTLRGLSQWHARGYLLSLIHI